MGIFNVLAFYFFALHADPHYSLLSMTSYMLAPQPTAAVYANGNKGYETSLSVSISAASVGSVVAQGNIGITEKAVFGNGIAVLSLMSYNNNWGISAGGGAFIGSGRRVEITGLLSYYSFYDLSEKYSFVSAAARAVIPFSWGPHIHPFAGFETGYGAYMMPANISSHAINGIGYKLIGGATLSFGTTSFTLTGAINNAMLGINAGMSFSVN